MDGEIRHRFRGRRKASFVFWAFERAALLCLLKGVLPSGKVDDLLAQLKVIPPKQEQRLWADDVALQKASWWEPKTPLREPKHEFPNRNSVAFCSPSKSLTFRRLMENPLVGKQIKS